MKHLAHDRIDSLISLLAAGFLFAAATVLTLGDDSPLRSELLTKPGLFKSLTEPPCSYCSTENRKGFVRDEDGEIAGFDVIHPAKDQRPEKIRRRFRANNRVGR